MEPATDRSRNHEPIVGALLRIRGRVQGVGFRPHALRLARALGLCGDICNHGDGVLLRAWGSEASLRELQRRLRYAPPPPASVESCLVEALPGPPAMEGFHIVSSQPGTGLCHLLPDLALCDACRAELQDPDNRRYRHPFISCTACGPRFSIAGALPYDRERTSMASFAMCGRCAGEYRDPADRRFHAQPIGCHECGPSLRLLPGETAGEHSLQGAIECLRNGGILAVKGIGGFHLMVDATRPEAIARLRRRKHRPFRPFALMVRDPEVARRYCRLRPEEAAALSSHVAPIVLLEQSGERLPDEVAPGMDRLGLMLPATALHLLLLEAFDRPLVCTSGNRSGAPLCAGNDEAVESLDGIADRFLLHDREIVHRCDDPVLQLAAGRMRTLRRGRGQVPEALPLPPGLENADGILAVGGDLKGGFCLLRQGCALLSQPFGELMHPDCRRRWREEMSAWLGLYGSRPRRIALDVHPDYGSHRHGRELARQLGVPAATVLHHHAHLAAVLAEHGHPLDAGPVLGLVLDGLGMGEAGALWGGELLLGDYQGYRRVAHLAPVPLPGGDRAAREPWR
ncbi:MAG: carbamoyltransferase HypF, partial [Gammaproteobacteria bacterium]